MARRRPDPRVRTNATPPCTITVGKNANRELALQMLFERCDHKTDDVRCEKHATVTHTKPNTGTIERYCLDHIGNQVAQRLTVVENEMYKRWALKFAQTAA